MANETGQIYQRVGRSAAVRGGVWLFAGVVWLLACGLAWAQFGELVAFESPGNTTYYVDAESGDDENAGTRPESAWRTLGRVNSTRFSPGDSILIKAGTTHAGKLWPKGTGIPGRPVTIDSYGEGARPIINANGEASAALLLENTNAWHVKNLELTNTGDEPEAFRYGVSILVEDRGEAGDFELTNLYVHDVNGAQEPGMGAGAGIIWRNRGAATPTRFNGLLVEDCVVKDCGRNGIAGESGYTKRDRWTPNVNVVVRENVIEGVGGSGILLTGCENAVVEYNRVTDAGGSRIGVAGGIELSGCDNSIVQYNEVGGMSGRESAAFRVGGNSRENTVQFNFSHDNAGAMAGLSAAVSADARGPSVGNQLTAVRYNISQDDHTAFSVSGPVADARLYNNTVYGGEDSRGFILRLEGRPAPPRGLEVANNLFYTLGSASVMLDGVGAEGSDTQNTESGAATPPCRFERNAYFGKIVNDGEPEPITDDPLLVDPGKAVSMDEGLEGYQLKAESPLRGAGKRMTGHGRYDFWSNPVGAGVAIDIGAHQGGLTADPAQTEQEADPGVDTVATPGADPGASPGASDNP